MQIVFTAQNVFKEPLLPVGVGLHPLDQGMEMIGH